MSLLQKEEEKDKSRKQLLQKIKLFLSMKSEIIAIDLNYADIINELGFLLSNNFEIEIIKNVFMEILLRMELDKRFNIILNRLKINRQYLTQVAIKLICLIDPFNKQYGPILKEILKETHLDEYEEKDGDITIQNSYREIQINRMFKLNKEINLKEILRFSTVMDGMQEKNCHGFNTTFYDKFPHGNIVTGNISSRFIDIRASHTWIENQGIAYVPNLNYSTSIEDYYYLFKPVDCVLIPYSRLNEDRSFWIRKKQAVNLYDYLINPDETMAKLK